MDAFFSQSVWVKYDDGGDAVQITVPASCNVSQLVRAIKGELKVVLEKHDVSHIKLHKKEEERKGIIP